MPSPRLPKICPIRSNLRLTHLQYVFIYAIQSLCPPSCLQYVLCYVIRTHIPPQLTLVCTHVIRYPHRTHTFHMSPHYNCLQYVLCYVIRSLPCLTSCLLRSFLSPSPTLTFNMSFMLFAVSFAPPLPSICPLFCYSQSSCPPPYICLLLFFVCFVGVICIFFFFLQSPSALLPSLCPHVIYILPTLSFYLSFVIVMGSYL